MRFSLLGMLIVVVCVAACRGADGPAGATGPTGPAGPTTRIATYCNTSDITVGAPNAWTVSVSCNAAKDIPVEGWCLAGTETGGTLPTGAYLTTATGPVNWNNTSAVAGWSCTWAWAPGSTQLAFSARAEICCETPP